MGRVKTVPVRRVTREIFERFRGEVKKDYAMNKEFLSRRIEVHSKKIRNIIAGYLTQLAKTQEA